MPGFLVTDGATVQCLHAGSARPTTVALRVRASGQAVLTQTSAMTVAGCVPPPPPGTPPCASAQWIVAALRVRATGVPVVLKDSQAVCVPTGTGLNVLSTQTRVKGV
jgi:hypothetical protein